MSWALARCGRRIQRGTGEWSRTWARRCDGTIVAVRQSHSGPKHAASDESLSSQIRALMRSSAQPVAVITTTLPPLDEHRHTQGAERPYFAHGATLSSFTTVSLDPPIVAFSLQTPSRLADALDKSSKAAEEAGDTPSPAYFVINVLSEQQASAAEGFSKPGLTPFPLPSSWLSASSHSSGSSPQDGNGREALAEHPLRVNEMRPSRHAVSVYDKSSSEDQVAVPVLARSVGALACSVLNKIPLREGDPGQGRPIGSSELFLARIHAVEEMADQEQQLPLLYWQRTFTSVKE